MGSTTYESNFPSGLMTPEYQLERRTTSPETVAAARLVNKIQAELRRTQEVIGISVPSTGIAWPTGTIMERITNIDGSGGAGMPFAPADPADPDYNFIKWFLEWMGLWDLLNVAGTPSITDVMRALWQNKYDLEILFEPRFMVFGTGGSGSNYLEYDMTGDVQVWAGVLNQVPSKPIGGFCNLSGRPYPVYNIYDQTDLQWLYGNVVLPSGHHMRFYTTAGLFPPAADDYMIQLYGNSPYQFLQSFGSGAIPLPTGLLPDPATPPEPVPPPPPPGPLPVPFPGPPDGPPDGWEPLPPEWVGPEDPTEINRIVFSKDFDVWVDARGMAFVSSTRLQMYEPASMDPGTGDLVTIPGSFLVGINTATIAAKANVALAPGWNAIFALLTAGNGIATTDDLHCFAYKLGFNDGAKGSWPPTEIDYDLDDVSFLANEYLWVPIGYVYADPEDAGLTYVTLSQEGMSPGNVYVVSFATRALGNKVSYV